MSVAAAKTAITSLRAAKTVEDGGGPLRTVLKKLGFKQNRRAVYGGLEPQSRRTLEKAGTAIKSR